MVTTRRRLLLGLVCFLPFLLAACAAPVTVERVDPRTVHRELTANVLTLSEESNASRIVLYRWDLTERFESDPEGALAQLHAAVVGERAGRDELFALAELSFLHAERAGKQEYYLAAAVYAYALLFPHGVAEPLYPVDPRLRLAVDLYNRGLTSAFASADRSVIELRGGTRALQARRREQSSRGVDHPSGATSDPAPLLARQYWFFYYDTGNPVTYSADVLRMSLRLIVDQLDPDGRDLALRQMVIIGHSQGGLLTKMTAIDSGSELWNTVSSRPLDELVLRESTREEFRRTLFFEPLPFVRRVIFIATPHRGSYVAGSWVAQWVAGFASLPKGFMDSVGELVTGNAGAIALSVGGLPRSIHHMTPGNPFVQALASIPVAPGIAANSIVAVKGEGPVEKDDDGIVEYSSAHLADVESELVVHSGHAVHGHPLAIAEVRRILYRHGEGACRLADVCGVTDNR